MRPPDYFDQVRAESADIWEKLEASPVLAGPWHRMFQQVQSPRHVLSELLQNADDAEATWASARIHGDTFVFEHNGKDFASSEFASLCRFGHSNKRALHTIGFRGVGFKSTFSLGNEVHLNTPTLSVSFHRSRFTEPKWVDKPMADRRMTTVSVELTTLGARRELETNLAEWLRSSVSLLFFRNIRSLQVNEFELRWVDTGPGPCLNSSWLKLEGTEDQVCLLVRSEPEPFPEDSIAEIQAERILSANEHLELPPCTVEILLYGDSRLYVVLPTGVETGLPFACNAPFIQDTARLKVKSPDSSPTNHWLMNRIGRLAAESMLSWLRDPMSASESLAKAYDLMPDVDREDSSLEGSCASAVELAFETGLEDEKFVLTSAGHLVTSGHVLDVPSDIADVWSASELTRVLSQPGMQVVSKNISDVNLQKLRNWRAVHHIDRKALLFQLKQVSPAKPQSWKQLLALWSYLFDDIPAYEWNNNDLRRLNVVPVQGRNSLCAANDVVRLGEKRLLGSEEDWNFLSNLLLAYNPNWARYLADQRKNAELEHDTEAARHVERAYGLQNHLRLTDSGDMGQVMRQVASKFFDSGEVSMEDCVRLSQIAAKLGATVGPEFQYVTQDEYYRHASEGIVADESGDILDIVPEEWGDSHILHNSYWSTWTSCTRQEWLEWIDSKKAELLRIPGISPIAKEFWTQLSFEAELKSRGHDGQYEKTYKKFHFVVGDSDFEQSLWRHWQELSKDDPSVWMTLMKLVLKQGPGFWRDHIDSIAVQVSSGGNKRQAVQSRISTSWILKFRELPCLPDSQGNARRPFEIMRRTAATESLLDIEPFLAADIDIEANRPLFDALQVRAIPTGPKQILGRIQALAESEVPPIEEVDKWYRRLDGLLSNCSTQDIAEVRSLFEAQPLILSAEHGWVHSSEVFLSATMDDVPDTPLIRPTVRHLELWRKVHVAERPNFELIRTWLLSLPIGEVLSLELAKRVEANLSRFAIEIWEQCGMWLNLNTELIAVSDFRFSLSKRAATSASDLFAHVRRETADFRMLDQEFLDRYPFSELPSLATEIDEQVSEQAAKSFSRSRPKWLEHFATNLARIETPNEEVRTRLRSTALRLAQTDWRQGSRLETVAYLQGVPAGPPRSVNAAWSGLNLFVEQASASRLAAPVAREIGKAFNFEGIREAVGFCYERSADHIRDYLEQEFSLSPISSGQFAEVGLQGATIHDSADLKEALAAHVGLDGPNIDITGMLSVNHDDTREPEVEEPEEETATKIVDSALWQPGSIVNDMDLESDLEVTEKPRGQSPKSDKPSLIERFAVALDLHSDGNGGFLGAGKALVRAQGSVYPWQLRDEGGGLIYHLHPQEACLEHEPIAVEAEVWGLLDRNPNSYALLLLSPDGSPQTLLGAEAKELLARGAIRLFPAQYRIAKVRQ